MKWEKFTLHTDHHTRTEKYRPWNKVCCCKIHSKRRQPHHERIEEPHFKDCSTDPGTFITSGHGIGYPPKTFIESDSDSNIPPHVPNLEGYCKTCISKETRCTCKPMSNWSAELIDITQLDCPIVIVIKMTGMMDKTTLYLQTGVTRKTFGQERHTTRLGPHH